MIGAGTVLPLMNLVFGNLVTAFNNFLVFGDGDELRRNINQYSLYFIYLFVAKLVLAYAWTVGTPLSACHYGTPLP